MSDIDSIPPLVTLGFAGDRQQRILASHVQARALDLYLASDQSPKRVRFSGRGTELFQITGQPLYRISHRGLTSEEELEADKLAARACDAGEIEIEAVSVTS